jgi:hypothetical protein
MMSPTMPSRRLSESRTGAYQECLLRPFHAYLKVEKHGSDCYNGHREPRQQPRHTVKSGEGISSLSKAHASRTSIDHRGVHTQNIELSVMFPCRTTPFPLSTTSSQRKSTPTCLEQNTGAGRVEETALALYGAITTNSEESVICARELTTMQKSSAGIAEADRALVSPNEKIWPTCWSPASSTGIMGSAVRQTAKSSWWNSFVGDENVNKPVDLKGARDRDATDRRAFLVAVSSQATTQMTSIR